MDGNLKNKKRKKDMIAVIVAGAVITLASIIVALVFIIIFFNSVVDKNILQNATVISAIAALLGVAVLVTGIYNYRVAGNQKVHEGIFSTKNITRIAIMTALSYVLYMFVKFPIPAIFPVWLEIQISDVPALICGFMMGPVSGCLVTVFKILLKLPFSTSLMVGELGDLLIGIAFVLPATLIYKFHKSRKGAVLGLLTGFLSSTAVAVLVNWLILVPWYVQLYFGGSWDAIVSACSAIYPAMTVDNFYFWYLLVAVVPFNLLRGIVSAIVTFLVYKSLGKLFNKMIPKQQK